MTDRQNLANKQLLEELAVLRTFYDHVHTSRSWKVTSPLRYLGRLLKRILQKNIGDTDTIGADADNHDVPFDPSFYARAYPLSAADPLNHYLTHGLPAGKPGVAPQLTESKNFGKLDPTKQTVLLVVHDADHSGTPILTYNLARELQEEFNLILLPLHGGALQPAFHQVADIALEPFPDAYDEHVASAVLDTVLSKVRIDCAIVNSIVSRSVLPILSAYCIPAVCLIHEFPTYITPKDAPLQAQLWAARTVYSSRLVYDNTVLQCPELQAIAPTIIPQGKCSPPNELFTGPGHCTKELTLQLKPADLPETTKLIIGVGTVEYRKGVDLFIDCAARLIDDYPDIPFHFAWVGSGYLPEKDLGYSSFLKDQIARSGLAGRFIFTGHVRRMDTVYAQADLLFLSSRLDPLPNTAIEAMCSGIPVVCFENTTGIADVLSEFRLNQHCVVPYLRTDLAAQSIAALFHHPKQLTELQSSIQTCATEYFKMKRYAGQVTEIAIGYRDNLRREQTDLAELDKSAPIDLEFFCPPGRSAQSKHQANRLFIRSWRSGIQRRKPFAGFHPGIFAEMQDIDLSSSNPLVEFIHAGRPSGPWSSPIIQPVHEKEQDDTHLIWQQRIGLHIHCFYPELFSSIFDHLQSQPIKHLDLLISTRSDETRELIREIIGNWTAGAVDIRIVPNRGRDIGPFLTEFADTITSSYDIIGHIHTKKSQDIEDDGLVRLWFSYLLQHLVGAPHQMLETILHAFMQNPQLGLVFPEDPYVTGWAANHVQARQLADSLGLADIGRTFFNFPVGNMFWARPAALSALFRLNLGWEDYPQEPIGHDGTILHALERITPFVAEHHGYQYALLHIPDMTR